MRLLETINYQESIGIDLDASSYLYAQSASNLDLEIILDVADRMGIREEAYSNWRHMLNL